MAGTRYNLISPRKRADKTYWAPVGSAWAKDDGSFSLSFDSLPLPDEKGEVRVLMSIPREQTGAANGNGQAQARPQQAAAGGGYQARRMEDDEIPF